MKKRLLLSCLTMSLLSSAFAQKNDLVSSLIEKKQFAFVASKVEQKPGTNGISANGNPANFDRLNPTTISIETSKKITTDASVASAVLTDYYRYGTDGSYFNVMNIKKNNSYVPPLSLNESIYLVQMPEKLLMVKQMYAFAGLDSVANEALDTYSAKEFKLLSKKKSDNQWLLKYRVGKGQKKKIFYLKVEEDGRAILQEEAGIDNQNVVYGKIFRTTPAENI